MYSWKFDTLRRRSTSETETQHNSRHHQIDDALSFQTIRPLTSTLLPSPPRVLFGIGEAELFRLPAFPSGSPRNTPNPHFSSSSLSPAPCTHRTVVPDLLTDDSLVAKQFNLASQKSEDEGIKAVIAESRRERSPPLGLVPTMPRPHLHIARCSWIFKFPPDAKLKRFEYSRVLSAIPPLVAIAAFSHKESTGAR